MDVDKFTRELKAESEKARLEGKERAAAAAAERDRARREHAAKADAAAKLGAFASRTAAVARALEDRRDAYVFWVLGDLELHRGGAGARRRGVFAMKPRGADRWEPSKTEMAGWLIERREYRGTRRAAIGWSAEQEDYTGVSVLVLLADSRLAIGQAPASKDDQPVVAPRTAEELIDNELWGQHVVGAISAFGKRYALGFPS